MFKSDASGLLEHRRVQIDDVEICYGVAGAGSPVVLVHGLGGSSRWWARNIQALARHYRVYCIDLIGFGDSRCDHPFALDEAAAWLAKWMLKMGLRRATVIGHSMGGYIAADLAADYPHLVERLVLVNAAIMPIGNNVVQHCLALAKEARPATLDLLPVFLRDAYRAGMRTLWRARNELCASDIRHKLLTIQAPTLIIWGEKDALLPLEHGRALLKLIPNAKLVRLRGCGHTPLWERPIEVNRVLLDFLKPQTAARRPARRSASAATATVQQTA